MFLGERPVQRNGKLMNAFKMSLNNATEFTCDEHTNEDTSYAAR